MARKHRDNLNRPPTDGLEPRTRSYRSIASLVEAFENKLLEDEKLTPARFLSDAVCKGIDKKILVGILEVSKRLVREGIWRGRLPQQ